MPRITKRAAMARASVSAIALTAVLTGALPAMAQSGARSEQVSQAPVLEEIIVTSRKRNEALLDIPIAITAFSAADIEKADFYDMREITKFAPGLRFMAVGGNGGGGRANPFVVFRGMNFSSTLPRQQTGAVFVDGIYVLGGVNGVNTVDVERVEVIKGPQNAYFGRNTFGGAINFITKNPGDEYKGQISAEGTEDNSYDMNLSGEGPISEGKLSARVSTVLHQKGAQYRANDGGALGKETTRSITGTLYATPTDNFWIRARGSYQHDSDGPSATSHLYAPLHGTAATSCAGKTYTALDAFTKQPMQFTPTLPYFCGSLPTLKQIGESKIVTANTSLLSPRLASLGNPNGLINGFVNNSLNNPLLAKAPKLDHFGLVRNQTRFNLQAEYEFTGGITLGINYGYDDTKQNSIFDQDRTDEENVYTAVPALFRTDTYEVRLQSAQDQRFRWLIGGTYYQGNFDAHFNGSVQYQVRTAPTAPIATAVTQNTPINRDGERAKVKAGFGAVQYDILDNLTLNGEIRYQKDQSRLQPSNPSTVIANFTDWLPRVIVNYKPDDDWTLYTSWSVGVLPGQFNTQYIGALPSQKRLIEAAFPGVQEVQPSERVNSYEIGSKQQLFDNRLQYTVAAYYMKWNNIKASSAFNTPAIPRAADDGPGAAIIPAQTFTGIGIAGKATLKGVEFEATGLITDKWDMTVRANWQEGKYDDLVNPFLAQLTAGVTRFDGNNLPRVPNWTGSLTSQYRDTFSGDWDWFVRGEASYTGKQWDSEANIVQTSDYWRVNARFGFENQDLMIEFFVKNLFNDSNWDYGFRNVYQGNAGAIFIPLPAPFTGFGFPQAIIVQPPDKREFGVRMRYDF